MGEAQSACALNSLRLLLPGVWVQSWESHTWKQGPSNLGFWEPVPWLLPIIPSFGKVLPDIMVLAKRSLLFSALCPAVTLRVKPGMVQWFSVNNQVPCPNRDS